MSWCSHVELLVAVVSWWSFQRNLTREHDDHIGQVVHNEAFMLLTTRPVIDNIRKAVNQIKWAHAAVTPRKDVEDRLLMVLSLLFFLYVYSGFFYTNRWWSTHNRIWVQVKTSKLYTQHISPEDFFPLLSFIHFCYLFDSLAFVSCCF